MTTLWLLPRPPSLEHEREKPALSAEEQPRTGMCRVVISWLEMLAQSFVLRP